MRFFCAIDRMDEIDVGDDGTQRYITLYYEMRFNASRRWREKIV